MNIIRVRKTPSIIYVCKEQHRDADHKEKKKEGEESVDKPAAVAGADGQDDG